MDFGIGTGSFDLTLVDFNFLCGLSNVAFLFLWEDVEIKFIFGASGCSLLLTSYNIVVKFGEIGQMMQNYLSVVLMLGTRIIVEPQGFEVGEFEQVSDLPEIGDAVFAEVEFLGVVRDT